MATNKIVINEGTGTNTATYSGTEDAVTKHTGRVVLNNSSLTEVGTSAAPLEVNLRSSTVGVSTAAKQPALGTAGTASADVITVQGITSMTALKVDGTGGSFPVTDSGGSLTVDYATTGSGNATGALRVELPTNGTGVIATVGAVTAITNALPAGTAIIGKFTTDQTTHGTTDLVASDVTKIAGTSIVTGGTAGTQAIGGIQAHDAADSGNNPVKIGAKAASSEPSAVSASGDIINLITDMVGKLIVLPYANPENFVNGTTAAITDTTSTSVIASAGGSLRNYVTDLTVTNSHATVGTFVKILDGSTIIWEGYAAALGGGFAKSFTIPLRGTAATAVNAQCVTTGANVIVSAAGYKGI